MRIKPGARLLLATSALASSACAEPPVARPGEIRLTGGSKAISGWFSAGGEWALYPDKLSRPYDPHSSNENAKCVSLINGTGGRRDALKRLHGKRVAVRGRAVDYDELPTGADPLEKLLSKKRFGNDVVEDFCLRQYVFVVTEMNQQ
jgi:hypothetical protein